MRLHYDDALARAGWTELSPEDRRLFQTERRPGAAAPAPTAGVPADPAGDPTGKTIEAGYGKFVVPEAIATHLDWLHVSPAGHRRAAFDWNGVGGVRATWLYP